MRPVLIAILLMSSAAQAGPTLSAGGGVAPSLAGEVQGVQVDASGGVGRVTIGQRWRFARVELGIGGFGISAIAPDGRQVDGLAVTASLSGVLRAALGRGVGAFGRGGVEHSWIGPTPSADVRLSGDGYLAGAGLDWGRDVGVWAEIDREWLRVSALGMTFDGTADSVIAGVRVGI